MNLVESLGTNNDDNTEQMVTGYINSDNGFTSLSGEIFSVNTEGQLYIDGTIGSRATILPDTLTLRADTISSITADLSDETINRIAERVYELIRQRGIE